MGSETSGTMLHCILQPLEVKEIVKESKYFFSTCQHGLFVRA